MHLLTIFIQASHCTLRINYYTKVFSGILTLTQFNWHGMITFSPSAKSYLLSLSVLVGCYGLVAIPSYMHNLLSDESLTIAALAAFLGHITGSLRFTVAQRQSSNDLDLSNNETISTVYVGNLLYRTSKEDLIELLRPFGEVISARIILDHDTHKSKGYGFVEMHSRSALQAISELDGLEFQGRTLRVTEAKDSPR